MKKTCGQSLGNSADMRGFIYDLYIDDCCSVHRNERPIGDMSRERSDLWAK